MAEMEMSQSTVTIAIWYALFSACASMAQVWYSRWCHYYFIMPMLFTLDYFSL